MTSPLHRLTIESDGPSAAETRISIDGHQTTTVTSVALTVDANGVTQATLGFLLVDGLNVDTVAKVVVDEATSQVLVALGWTPPPEPAP